MNTRVITDPSALGWEQDGATANGTPIYKWAEGADNEHPIVDGDTEGQVTTWDGAKWTPDSSLTIDATGNATFSGGVIIGPHQAKTGHNFSLGKLDGPVISVNTSATPRPEEVTDGHSSVIRFNAYLDNSQVDFGAVSFRARNFYVESNAHFTGTVDAAGFTVNGSPISGGGDLGSTIILENKSAPADNKNFAIDVDNDGSLAFQARLDSLGGGGNFFKFTRSNNQVQRLEALRSGNAVGWWDIATNTITATDFIATSDERAKDNITTAPVGLIDSIKGREWDWKESGEKGSGVVAQELEQVLPHLVHTDDDGMKSVAYNGLVAYLIEEVKALRAEVEALK